MRTRLHSLTSICLAVIYGLAGVTGESLHYLVQDLQAAFQSKSTPIASWQHVEGKRRPHGFFHIHAPDCQLHYHQGVVADQPQEGALAGSANAKPAGKPCQESLNSDREFHTQHACPLLTFVSTLKLGSGSATPVDFEPATSHASLCEISSLLISQSASCHLARGPPKAERLA